MARSHEMAIPEPAGIMKILMLILTIVLICPKGWTNRNNIHEAIRLVETKYRQQKMSESGYKKLAEEGWESFEDIYDNPKAQFAAELKRAYEVHYSPYTMMKGTQLLYFFPETSLPGIVKNGILNIHQTHKTGGANKKEKRALFEASMIGAIFEEKYDSSKDNEAHYMRPKYTILDVSGVPYYKNYHSNGLNYGRIVAVLKDNVKKRATWAPGDTLDFYVPTFTFKTEMREVFEAQGYFEAQVWGELDLRDIKEFWIPSDLKPNQVEKLISLGLPIFGYSEKLQKYGKNKIVKNKKPLSIGNPKIIQLLKDDTHSEDWDFLYTKYLEILKFNPPSQLKKIRTVLNPKGPTVDQCISFYKNSAESF
jgi:hypothetical protein